MADVQSGIYLYDPKETVIKVNGVRVYNWMRARASYNEARNSFADSTAHGTLLAVRNNSLAGTVEIELSQRGFEEIATIQGLSGSDLFSVEIKDGSKTPANASMGEAFLQDDPGLERAKDASTHTATFGGELTFGEGGIG